MIIDMRNELKQARWLWLLIALSMLTGSGLGYWIKMWRRGGVGSGVIGLVNGREISAARWRKALLQEEMLRQQLKRYGIDFGSFKTSESELMRRCAVETQLDALAEQLKLQVDDQVLKKSLIKTLKRSGLLADDYSDLDQKLSYIAQSLGMTTAEFQEDHRLELARQIVMQLLQDSFAAWPVHLDLDAKKDEAKSFAMCEFKLASFKQALAEKGFDEQELVHYYQTHKDKYLTKHKADCGVVVFNPEVVNIVVDEQEIEDYYTRHLSEYQTGAKYRINNFVFPNKGADIEAGKTLVEGWVKMLKEEQRGLEASQKRLADQGVECRASDSDWFELGRGKFEDEIESALLNLQKGEVSSIFVVNGEFQVVQLIDKQAAITKSLDSLKSEISKTIKAKRIEHELHRMAESFGRAWRNNPAMNANELQAELKAVGYDRSLEYGEATLTADGVEALSDKDLEWALDAVHNRVKPRLTALEAGSVGSVRSEGFELVYNILAAKPQMTKPYSEVEKQVYQDLLSQQAHRELETTVKEQQRLLLENVELNLQDLDQPGAEFLTTKLLSQAEAMDTYKESKHSWLPGLLGQAYKMNAAGQYLVYTADESMVIATLIEQKSLSSEEGKVQEGATRGFRDGQQRYTQALLAQLLENAKIELFGKDENE